MTSIYFFSIVVGRFKTKKKNVMIIVLGFDEILSRGRGPRGRRARLAKRPLAAAWLYRGGIGG